MASRSWRAVRTSPARRPALLAPWLATYVSADAGTLILRPRFPASITTSAVMTLVTLPIGRLVPASRLHSRWPVLPSASSAPGARTPAGAAATGPWPASATALARTVPVGTLAGEALPAGAAFAGTAARPPRRPAHLGRRPGRHPGGRDGAQDGRDGEAGGRPHDTQGNHMVTSGG